MARRLPYRLLTLEPLPLGIIKRQGRNYSRHVHVIPANEESLLRRSFGRRHPCQANTSPQRGAEARAGKAANWLASLDHLTTFRSHAETIDHLEPYQPRPGSLRL